MSTTSDEKSEKILEAILTAKDIQKLKKDNILTKKIFVTTLILKYKPNKKRKSKKKIEE